MQGYRILRTANQALDEIADYTTQRWGPDQAKQYLEGMFERLGEITGNRALWRVMPDHFGVDGYYARYRNHYIYWREHPDGNIRIVSILHERMDQPARVSTEFSAKQ